MTSCASISEEECQAGNWADLGYRDGVNGKPRDRIADYVQTCGEYNTGVDRPAYLASYDTGLTHYCTYDKGFERGQNGSSYNTVCAGPANPEGAVDFRAGYDEGYVEYELHQKYKQLENNIVDAEDELQDVKDRLAYPDIASDEKDRLTKKKKRLRRELEDLRWDYRRFKREYDLDW